MEKEKKVTKAKEKKVTKAKEKKVTKKVVKTSKRKTKKLSMFSKEFYTKENLKKVFLEEVKKEHKGIILFVSALIISLMIYMSLSFILDSVKIVKPVFNNIDALRYEEIAREESKNVVFVSSPSEEYNVKYKKIVEEVVKSKKMEIYYLDLEQVKKNNLLNVFMLAAEETKKSYKDPMIIIFEKGKVKDILEEISTKEEITTFFDKNRID